MILHEMDEGIRVDDFSPGGTHYFLTHCHADHLKGLRRSWSEGPLYLSGVSQAVLREFRKVDATRFAPLNPGETAVVERPGAPPLRVHALDANHCPGALMLIFDDGARRVLVTGDFRTNDGMMRELDRFRPFAAAYVDQTYRGRGARFPSQEEAIESVVRLCEENPDKTVFLGGYRLGKNWLFARLAERFNTKIHVDAEFYRIHKALGYAHVVTLKKSETRFRLVSMGKLRRGGSGGEDDLEILPTGWGAVEAPPRRNRHFIPYSEHCDSEEIERFIQWLAPAAVKEFP